MNTYRMNLTVDRVAEMSEREIYDLVDHYLKGRFARFAVDIETQSLLEQRDLKREDRDPEYDTAFEAARKAVHDVLYDKEILPRHRFALDQMRRAVESQLATAEGTPDASWKRTAQWFLDLVKDEMARVDVVMEEWREESAQKQLNMLLKAIECHRQAEDADAADDRLYSIADTIKHGMPVSV